MSHIFISYNQEDSDFAAVLMMNIEKAGYDTWMDKSRLRPGSDWSEAIDRGIRDAIAMVVVMSPAAKASEYVTYEWGYAVGAGLIVIPVLYKRTDLHPRLARFQYLDFTNPSVRPWTELTREIQELANHQSRVRLDATTPPYIRHAAVFIDAATPEDRAGAIHTLGNAMQRDEVARDILISALDHALVDVRAHAATELIRGATPELQDRLLLALEEGVSCGMLPDYVPAFSSRVLLPVGATGFNLFIACLRSRSGVIRKAAIHVIGVLQISGAIDDLASLLADTDLRVEVAQSLGAIGDKSAIPYLVQALSRCYEPNFSLRIVEALIALEAGDGIGPAIQTLHDFGSRPFLGEGDGKFISATIDLTRLGLSSNNEAALIAELGNEHSDIRAAAAIALGLAKSTKAVGPISKLIPDDESLRVVWLVRKWTDLLAPNLSRKVPASNVNDMAVFALISIGTTDAIEILKVAKLPFVFRDNVRLAT